MNGRIEYYRHKTGQFSIKVSQRHNLVPDKYKGDDTCLILWITIVKYTSLLLALTEH